MFGIILGYYLPHIEEWFRSLSRSARRSVFIMVVGIAFASYVFSMLLFVVGPLTLPASSPWMTLYAHLLPYFEKNHLAPARVAVGVLWFAAIYMVYRVYEKPISKYTRGVLEVFGKQSLFVYTFHAFILFILDLYFIPPVGHSIAENTLVTFVVVIIIYIAAYYRGHVTAVGKRLLKNRATTQVP